MIKGVKMQNQEKRVYEVTRGQIWVALIITAIALTITFEVGVWVGKKRVINAEREAAQQNDMQMRADTRVPMEKDLPYGEPTGRPTERPEVEKKEPKYTVQVGIFSSYENAVDMVKLLESYEYIAWLNPESDAEKTLYRVFVGRFDTEVEAEQFGRSLRERLTYITEYKVREIEE